MNCRFCNTNLDVEFIDLVASPPSNSYLRKDQLHDAETYYPLNVYVCSKCLLVQIDEYKNNEEIFNEDYAYFSSYSTSWLKHCESYVKMISQKLNLSNESHIIEIASNDGYLLQYFKKENIPCLGIEPTSNTAEIAKQKGIETIVDFFSSKLANELIKNKKGADLIIGNNVLAHDPSLNDLVEGLHIVLNKEGVVNMEFPHIMQLIKHNQFDTIYHEHFSYFSLYAIIQIFKAHKLDIFDVEELSTHGGSLRIYAKHEDNANLKLSENVKKVLEKENKLNLHSIDGYKHFQKNADKVKYELLKFLISCKEKNLSVAAYGAAAKGNTLINYCGIKADLISYVVDASPAKQNKFLPGSRIPVVNESELKKTKPDYVIILPWNLKDEILKQLDYINEWNGSFVIPIPKLEII